MTADNRAVNKKVGTFVVSVLVAYVSVDIVAMMATHMPEARTKEEIKI